MLTELRIQNFKKFDATTIPLGSPVVFIGPNNSGKTTALQALALWEIGLRRWLEKRGGGEAPAKRPGVTINRRDLIAVPVPAANLLWRELHTRDTGMVDGKKQTTNVRIDVCVSGVSEGAAWQCGLEFDYANEESFYCRPSRQHDGSQIRMPVPDQAADVRIAFLPPMSGLAANEIRLDPGAVQVRLGEGRTAEVLRNLCYQLVSELRGISAWTQICERVQKLFGVQLNEPEYIAERGEIEMTYRDVSGCELDISSSGRGLQQTLLLLSYIAVNPGSVLLLDEPDAHLEILRQRQIYQVICRAARAAGSQIIAASHSEVVLNEAADRDMVVAFLGRPHRIDDRGSQLRKSLQDIGYDQYYQAELTGWVLYLEGSTDLAILQALARLLGHPAQRVLDRPFVHYVANQPAKARHHFNGLREAKPDLVGIAIFDRTTQMLRTSSPLAEQMWARREIENYIVTPGVLMRWAAHEATCQGDGELFADVWVRAMEQSIGEVQKAILTLKKKDPWGPDSKVSDDFLDPLFATFYERLGLPNLMRKSDYHALVDHLEANEIAPEVSDMLTAIQSVAEQARPVR